MTTTRVLPPNTSGIDTITVNGRTYSASAGGFLDVPDFDAAVMLANGWVRGALGGSGATSARPIKPPFNTVFMDTSLSLLIVWDGKVWRNKITGAAV